MKKLKKLEVKITKARSDTENLFKLSTILKGGDPHHPYIVITTSEKGVQVDIVKSLKALRLYPAGTDVLYQWGGKKKSDFFKTTVGEIVDRLNDTYGGTR